MNDDSQELLERMSKERDQLVRDYKNVFASDAGQRVLKDLLINGKVYDLDIFAAGQADQTAFNLGRRSLALRIKNMIEFDLGEKKDRKTVMEVKDVQD